MIIALLLAVATQIGGDASLKVPHQFRGTWARNEAACDDPSSPDWVEFGETSTLNAFSRGVLKRARVKSESSSLISYSLSFLMAEEGKGWRNDFILSWRQQDPDKLVWTQPKRQHLWHGSFTLVRCSNKGSEV